MPEDPWFKWYPKDADTDENLRMMSDQQLGFYVRCLNHAWTNYGLPVDANALQRIFKCTKEYFDGVWNLVGRCFVEDDGRLVNPKQENLRSLKNKVSKSRKRAAKARWKCIASADANASQTAYDLSGSGSKSTSSFSKSKREEKFSEFWSIVWEKIAVGAARKSFERKALTVELADKIIAAAKQQGPTLKAEAAKHDRSVLHPSTWLNQERYEDEATESSTCVYCGRGNPAPGEACNVCGATRERRP